MCKRPWILICHQSAVKLKARLLPPCALVSSSNEGLARPSLWSLPKFFLAAGRILDPSVLSPFHVPSHCRDEGKPNYRCLCSQTEVLVKYRLRFLTLVHSSPSQTSLVSYFWTVHHKLIRMVACWLLFYYGSNSIIFLQNVTLTKCTFLVHYPMQSWHIVLSLLLFWISSFCILLSVGELHPQNQYFTLGHFSPHSYSLERSEKYRWFILRCGKQIQV